MSPVMAWPGSRWLRQRKTDLLKTGEKRGFTLIEMLIVLTILGLLVTLVLPNYFASIQKSKEAVLKEDLFILRDLIDKYRTDKGVYPPSLDALVEERYLRSFPVDPITGERDTWIEIASDDLDEEAYGIYDIKSGSDDVDRNGIPYSEW